MIVHRVIDELVGKGRIDVLVHNVKDDGDVDDVAGVDQAFQTVGTTKARVGREVMQRAIAPVEIEFDACHGHEFEAVDAETLEIVEAVDDAVERVVELFKLELIDDKVVDLGCLVVGIRPCEDRRAASKGECGELSDFRRAGERIREPESKHLRSGTGTRRGPQKLEAIEIGTLLTEVTRSSRGGY